MSRTRYRLKEASYAKYTAGGAVAGGLAGLGASASRGQGAKKRKRSALVGAALGGAAGAGAYRLRKAPSMEAFLKKEKSILARDVAAKRAIGKRAIDKFDQPGQAVLRSGKYQAMHKELENVRIKASLPGTPNAEAVRLQDKATRLQDKLDDMFLKAYAKPGSKSLAAGSAGLGGAVAYGASSKEASDADQVSQQILEGAYGEQAQKALMGVREAQQEVLGSQISKEASDPWNTDTSPLFENPEESRKQRLNTLLRRY